MKVLLFGHSYVGHLQDLGNWPAKLTLPEPEKFEVNVEWHFMSFPGLDYAHFVNNTADLDKSREINTDVIVIILGGNSIRINIPRAEVKQCMLDFWRLLGNYVNPQCCKIGVYIEPRYYSEGNRFGAPTAEAFRTEVYSLNNFMHRVLKHRGLINKCLMLGGELGLKDPNNYLSDGVHLKRQRLFVYRDYVYNIVR